MTNRWLGWWQPSESLTDPNILGSVIPALMPIAVSLQAGFTEECVFRAIPLSLAALVGQRFLRRLLRHGDPGHPQGAAAAGAGAAHRRARLRHRVPRQGHEMSATSDTSDTSDTRHSKDMT